MNWLWVGLGGALGSLIRAATKHLLPSNPVLFESANATLSVNLLGCFLIGILYQWSLSKPLSPAMTSFLMMGLLGGLTTYSTFMLDVVDMAEKKSVMLAFGYVGISVCGGLGCFWVGQWLVKRISDYLT
ncbi:MAG: CrcB family protein [Bdellovibrionota bacterium]